MVTDCVSEERGRRLKYLTVTNWSAKLVPWFCTCSEDCISRCLWEWVETHILVIHGLSIRSCWMPAPPSGPLAASSWDWTDLGLCWAAFPAPEPYLLKACQRSLIQIRSCTVPCSTLHHSNRPLGRLCSYQSIFMALHHFQLSPVPRQERSLNTSERDLTWAQQHWSKYDESVFARASQHVPKLLYRYLGGASSV